ncbi:hypothetical protein QWY86_18770 [Pedobacter aquatilis]|uniref:hypothetical protein n=1 Tax=Pedobacter aquatilis TaxID=351343 RepID=UPI0025B5E2B3|nr:hypothetical protein [Pedobacter aquatilis]MDN3588732.1 hypothetical protein [Pedobacter aquatilis]
MKKHIIYMLIISIGLFISACKKDNSLVDEINKTEIQKKQIQQIIPDKYLDSLKKLGLTINTGITPANVEGNYAINPLLLESTNIPKDFKIGYRFNDARVNLTKQDADFNIFLLGKNFLAERDTSIVTAISGSGNDITIYGKVKSTKAGKVAEFAIILTAKLENKTFKGFKYGLICISNKNGETDNTFIKEGQGRVVYESDEISTAITLGDFLATTPQKQLIQNSGASKFEFIN